MHIERMPAPRTLKEVRERLLRYRAETVAQLTGISLERLAAIEGSRSPTVYELEALSRVYGIESERLGEEPIKLAPGDAVAVLASLDEFCGRSSRSDNRAQSPGQE